MTARGVASNYYLQKVKITYPRAHYSRGYLPESPSIQERRDDQVLKPLDASASDRHFQDKDLTRKLRPDCKLEERPAVVEYCYTQLDPLLRGCLSKVFRPIQVPFRQR